MLDYIYPEEEQHFFTDREHHLALLGLSKDLLAQGVRKHLAFSGFRRIGDGRPERVLASPFG